ncbi:MAG: acyl-CoA dehydrogenase family protein [Solirubrobacteraceae bacterium]
MDLTISDEQQFLRESIRGTVDRETPLPKVREWVLETEPANHRSALEIAIRQGWTGIGISEEHGGQGGDLLELAILAEELGRCAVPADFLYASLLAASALSRSSAATEAPELIEKLAEGGELATLVHPGDRAADVPLTESSAALVFGVAETAHLISYTGDELAVHAASSAERSPRLHVDRTRSLTDVTLLSEPSARYRLSDPDAMHDLASRAAVMIAADALGAAQRMLDLTVEYVADRVQFGVPVGSFQAVKHTAAEMLVAIEGTRAAVEYAAWAVGAGEPTGVTDAWVAKARASRTASFVADKALFLHGAVGYTWEHDLQLLFKRAKSDAELFGGAGAYDERIADSLSLTQPVSTSTQSPSRETVSA